MTASLDEASLLRGQARSAPVDDLSQWLAALSAADRAKTLLIAGESDAGLRGRVDQLIATLEQEEADAAHRAREREKDVKFIERLESIRFGLLREGSGDDRDREKQAFLAANAAYMQALRDFGIDVEALRAEDAAGRIRSRSNPDEITFFLDEWAILRDRKSAWSDLDEAARDAARLLDVVCLTDPDPWRNSIRGASLDVLHHAASNGKTLEQQPPRSLLILAKSLTPVEYGDQQDYDAADSVLRLAWKKAPDDFWINYQLARTAQAGRGGDQDPNRERIRYASVAVALRPNNAWVRETFGDALVFVDNLRPGFRWSKDEATPIYDKGLQKPNEHRLDAAIEEYRTAIRLLPDEGHLHQALGRALIHKKDRAD